MDQTFPNQQSGEPQGVVLRNSNGKKILLEILSFILLLILVLGILNYFNIIPLSSMFPNQLGWLPHRVSQQSQQSNNVAIVPTLTPIPSLAEQGKQVLTDALSNILIPSLVPSSSQEIKIYNNQIPESFTSTWTTNESTVSAILIVTPDGKNISQLHLSFRKDQNKPPSLATAPELTSEFFSVEPKGAWGCKQVNNSKPSMIYCENFWEGIDGTKIGIGAEGIFTQGPALVNKSPEVLVFFCQRSKENMLYSWKSCSSEFSQTGVTP